MKSFEEKLYKNSIVFNIFTLLSYCLIPLA
jgi:hypothetical protein